MKRTIMQKKWNAASRRLVAVIKSMRISWLMVVSALAVFLATGCSTSQFKAFSFEHRTTPNSQYPVSYVTHFSFEYPGEYRRVETYAVEDPIPPIHVRFARGPFWSRANSTFEVSVGNAIYPHETPGTAVEETLSQRDYQPVETSSVSVAGVPGQLVAFRSRGFGYLAYLPEIEVRTVFFEADGRLWYISMAADVRRAEQSKLEFDHIVETFSTLR